MKRMIVLAAVMACACAWAGSYGVNATIHADTATNVPATGMIGGTVASNVVSGAALGATAVQPTALSAYVPLIGATLQGSLDTGENDFLAWKITSRNDQTDYFDLIANEFKSDNVSSIGYSTRLLYDDFGKHSLDWNSRALYGPEVETPVLTWDNNGFYGSSSSLSGCPSGAVAATNGTATNLTLTGTVTFGNETRTNWPTGTAVSFVSYTNSLGTVTAQVWTIGGSVFTNFFTRYPAKVPRTGQTTSYATGDDGALQKGVAWPSPVWTILGNTNCVRHNLTGLIWPRDIDGLLTTNTWDGQHAAVSNLNATSYGGRSDWRVPSVREALSVFDNRYYQPALCNSAGTGQWTSGDPFFIASAGTTRNFWTSSNYPANTNNAMWVYVRYGNLSGVSPRTSLYYCWPCAGPD